MSRELKVYCIRNYDGTNSAAVACYSKTEAQRLIGVSSYHWKNYGGHIATGLDIKNMMEAPGTVFYQPLDSSYGPFRCPWCVLQYERAYTKPKSGRVWGMSIGYKLRRRHITRTRKVSTR